MPGDLQQRIETTLADVLRSKTEEMQQELAARLRDDWEALERSCEGRVRQARQETAESLAAAVQRIRAESSVIHIAHTLVDAAAAFTGRTGLFLLRDDRLLGFRAGGALSDDVKQRFEQIDIAIAEAASMAHAAETRDSVVTSGEGTNLSPTLVELFDLTSKGRAYLFPVVLRDRVLALLYADAGTEPAEVQSAAIEVLVGVAEAWIEAVGSRRKAAPAPEEAAV